MKKIIYIVTILCMLFAQSVVAYEGMEIEWIKFYVNDERKSGADEGGGDFYADAGDELKIIIKFYNHNNTMTEVEMEAVIENIDDGDDLTKDHDWFDVDDYDDKSKEFNFLIPDDAMEDDYEINLEITYKYNNGTQETLDKIDWEMTIRDESSSTKKIDLESSFDNLTNLCGEFVTGINNCFGYINRTDSCDDDLSTCKQERGVCVSERNIFSTDYDECNNERVDLKKQVQTKDNQLDNMVKRDVCDKEIDEEVEDKKKQMQQYGLILALAAGGLYLWDKKKKEGQDVSKEFYRDQG